MSACWRPLRRTIGIFSRILPRAQAYDDSPVAIGCGQTIPSPAWSCV